MRLEDAGYDADGYGQMRIVYDGPLDEAIHELHKYEMIRDLRRSECISVSGKEELFTLNMIEYWKRRLVDLKSFNIPGWDLI